MESLCVDVYDFHWYPEVYDAGSTRITAMSGSSLTDTQVQQIVQAPRDFWDPTPARPEQQ